MGYEKITVNTLLENKVILSKDDFKKLTKERLDFGFDSLYFRYAIAIDELRAYKEKESKAKAEKNTDFKNWANSQKMHYYRVLEELVYAHEDSIDGTYY